MVNLTPPLKSGPDSKIAAFTEAGKWDQRELSELDKLAESLNVDIVAPAWLELSGIPDMWARPTMFEIALFDVNHLLHKRTVGEWRGLLAVLALREVCGFNVTITSIDIGASNKFFKALEKMLPMRILENGATWDKLSIIYYDGKPLGITNPMTLVCTSASLVNLGKVPWVEDLRLSDPISKLNNHKKQQLTTWLTNLRDGVRKQYGADNIGKANNLLRMIQSYIFDLSVQPCTIHDGVNILSLPGIYKYISKAVARGNQVETHLAIIGTKGASYKPIIVVEPDIAQQWGMSSHDIVIYNGVTLDQIPLGGIKDESIIGTFTLTNHRVWESKKLFTDILHLITYRNALPLAYSSEGGDSIDIDGDICTPLFPLSADLLSYFLPQDLSNRVSYHQDGDVVIVTLTIPLSGCSGEPSEYRATRKYLRSGGEIALIPNIPLLSIWPNFVAPNWNLYYSLYWSESVSTFAAEPVTECMTPEDNTRTIRGGRIDQLESFPEVYRCTFRDKNAGMILIKKPEKIPNATRDKWIIGVDFGTTGTNIYYSSSQTGDIPRFPVLKRRHLLVTAAIETEELNLIFMPNDDQSKTFLSIFRDVSRSAHTSYKPLLDGHIFFLSASDSLRKYEAKGQLGDLRDDLKWGGEVDNNVHKLVKTFLKQLCLQTMAEAAYEGADDISWRYSYPSSFSYHLRNNYEQAWKQVADECQKETRLGGGRVSHEPESVAAAKYFHSSPEIEGTFTTGAICLDIGGGTSDISIWHDRVLVWQTSLRFAGRDIFTNLMQNNARLRDILGFSKSGSDRYARIDMETNIRQGADRAIKRLNDAFDDPAIKKMQRIICLSIAAIFYYVGLAVKKLISEQKITTTDCPNIYVAGGGSQLFHWAAGGKFDENHKIGQLFKAMFAEAAELNFSPKAFQTMISPKPKDEAAIGLVSNSALTYDDSVLEPVYLSGEGFILNGKEMPYDSLIEASSLAGASLKRVDPMIFIKFLKSFNSKCTDFGISQIEYIDSLAQIGMKIDELFSNYKDSKKDNIQIEPVFISYVKILVQNIGKI